MLQILYGVSRLHTAPDFGFIHQIAISSRTYVCETFFFSLKSLSSFSIEKKNTEKEQSYTFRGFRKEMVTNLQT